MSVNKYDPTTGLLTPVAGTENVVFGGATASTNGTKGLVPAPSAGDEDKVLQGNGTFGKKLQIDVVIQNNTYGYIGANNAFIPFKSQADIDAAVSAAIENLAPAYNASSTYAVGDLVTYSGKLYKCIVAVTAQEAFNINKWDDVTTSEVYAQVIRTASFPSDGVKTFANLLDDVGAFIYNNISNISINRLAMAYGGANFKAYYKLESLDRTYNAKFSSTVILSNLTTFRSSSLIASFTSKSSHNISIDITSEGITFASNDSNVVPLGDEYTLYY